MNTTTPTTSFSAPPVLIVGAGPVGMTLALDLGSRGIPVRVLEESLHTTTNPRCNTTNARSMEYFRRLGIADRIRRGGLPGDHPTDAVYTTSITGYELTRFEMSSSDEIFAGAAPEAAEWPTSELQHRISQLYLEPILADELTRYPSVICERGVRVEEVDQDAGAAIVRAVDVITGKQVEYRAAYVVGCDGGASVVRRAVGKFEGDPRVGDRRMSIHFRSDDIDFGPRPGWWYWWHGEHHHGAFMQLDGRSEYICHARVQDGEDLQTADPERALREAVGRDFEHEIIGVVRWSPRRLVADRFRRGRLLLAGDAAHIWLNLGGFGMNAGIADAVGLGWRLAGIHAGWGTPDLLDDYEMERQRVNDSTSRAAASIGTYLEKAFADPRLREASADGEALRREVGARLHQRDRAQWYSKGVQLGLSYAGSPGVADTHDEPVTEGGDLGDYQPSVRPGARLPHHWLGPGEAVFDRLGTYFTLLRVGPEAPAGDELLAAAGALGVPLTVLELPATARSSYERALVLVRPDMHVAWSGEALPLDARGLLGRLCGYGRVEVTPAAADSQPERRPAEG